MMAMIAIYGPQAPSGALPHLEPAGLPSLLLVLGYGPCVCQDYMTVPVSSCCVMDA